MRNSNFNELLVFTRQFAFMLSSRLPLVEVLENLAKETYNTRLRATAEELVRQVRGGHDLANAMGMHPHFFDSVFVNVIRSGLASGRLDLSLLMMAEYLERRENMRDKIERAMAYPAFLFVAILFLVISIINWILPNFEKVFKSLNAELPKPTQIVLDIAQFVRQHGVELSITIVAVVAIMLVFFSRRTGRAWWDQFKLNLPVFGRLYRQASLSRFLKTFSVQIKNEVEILEALEYAAGAADNLFIEAIIFAIILDVRRGVTVSQAFRKHQVFEGLVMQMISSGDEAGELSDLTYRAANYFEQLLENRLDQLVARINPIMTSILGLVVVGLMLAIFAPIFDLGNAARASQHQQMVRPP
ncbi:Type II secretion system protein F [Candidatus Magnetaquicoccaceae bacterium FCR-1]|uniref:Type II secretion system protein F n=1 Tax=Candidatus Magnetaquiglobus chichijimensis TaxID=3141448 RepID=A0ABQ0CDC6_9PROT